MSVLRRFAELASRNRTIVRHTPSEFGRRPLVVSPDASLRWLRRDPWRDDAELLLAISLLIQSDDVVWDLGANVGAFALCAAHRTRHPLLMVEADPFLSSLLRRTVRRNPDLSIDLLCCAIADRAGTARFSIAGRGRNSNGLSQGAISTQHGKTREEIVVPTISVDLLLDCFPAPSVIKVDLEGGEALFMQGAERLLREVRPTCYIEVHRDNRPTVFSAFRRHDYRLKQNLHGTWIDVTNDPPSENFFAFPSERAALPTS